MLIIFLHSLLILSSFAQQPYDCSKFEPFTPIETLKADVIVHQLAPLEKEVCKSSTPLLIPVKDIRGREADWYYCNQTEITEYLTCDVIYKNKPAQIYIKPAIVIRQWQPTDALDTHIHTYLVPEGNWDQYHDNFSRMIHNDLSLREVTLEGSAGGRGPKADQESYFVRVKFYR